MNERMTVAAAIDAVKSSPDKRYAALEERGSLEIGFYAPDTIDPQQAHDRDEVYVVQSGSGEFLCGRERREFEAGEALFVPAGVTHRFENFSGDFSTWVVFYGPVGGERPVDDGG